MVLFKLSVFGHETHLCEKMNRKGSLSFSQSNEIMKNNSVLTLVGAVGTTVFQSAFRSSVTLIRE